MINQHKEENQIHAVIIIRVVPENSRGAMKIEIQIAPETRN